MTVYRYQALLSLILVSSLGFAAPVGGGVNGFNNGLIGQNNGQGNLAQQRQQAQANADFQAAQARQQATAEIARLEQGAAAAKKEIAASKTRQVALKEAFETAVAASNNVVEDSIVKLTEMQTPDADAIGALTRAFLAPFMDEKNKVLAGNNIEAVIAKKKKLETDAPAAMRETRSTANNSFKAANNEGIVQTFTAAVEAPFKDFVLGTNTAMEIKKAQALELAAAFAGFRKEIGQQSPKRVVAASTGAAADAEKSHTGE
jgi:hypothetical protein